MNGRDFHPSEDAVRAVHVTTAQHDETTRPAPKCGCGSLGIALAYSNHVNHDVRRRFQRSSWKRHHRHGGGAIVNVRDVYRKVGLVLATMADRDCVTLSGKLAHHVGADEPRPTDDQDVHTKVALGQLPRVLIPEPWSEAEMHSVIAPAALLSVKRYQRFSIDESTQEHLLPVRLPAIHSASI